MPVLVLGTGQRCGSTLMQRLLLSHPDAFVWGENGGHLKAMLDAADNLAVKAASRGAHRGREDFDELGYQAFIANLIPPPDEIAGAFCGFIERLFAMKPVWGFKEVRFDLAFAQRFQRYFPAVRVIFVIRDPRDILSSIDEWERIGNWPRSATAELMRSWQRIASSFEAETDLPVLKLRYEDYTGDPESTIDRVAEFTDLDPKGFDPAVFDRRIHMHGASGEGTRDLRSFVDLPAEMRAFLDDADLIRTAHAYGYRL